MRPGGIRVVTSFRRMTSTPVFRLVRICRDLERFTGTPSNSDQQFQLTATVAAFGAAVTWRYIAIATHPASNHRLRTRFEMSKPRLLLVHCATILQPRKDKSEVKDFRPLLIRG